MSFAGNFDGFARHIHACRTAVLPGSRRKLRFQGADVGFMKPHTLAQLGRPDADLDVPDQDTLDHYARILCTGGLHRWRNEAFDVRAPDGTPVATLDRGALPLFGIQAIGVHMNGLVAGPDGWSLWIGRRALDKILDPGKLDHLVAGGVPAGLSPDQALVKEAAEEAGITAALAATAKHVGEICYDMERPEGLRRDRLICYDLILPADFVPVPVDGEAIGFDLIPINRVIELVRDTDQFKFNVNLVLIDLFLRLGLIENPELRHALDQP